MVVNNLGCERKASVKAEEAERIHEAQSMPGHKVVGVYGTARAECRANILIQPVASRIKRNKKKKPVVYTSRSFESLVFIIV